MSRGVQLNSNLLQLIKIIVTIIQKITAFGHIYLLLFANVCAAVMAGMLIEGQGEFGSFVLSVCKIWFVSAIVGIGLLLFYEFWKTARKQSQQAGKGRASGPRGPARATAPKQAEAPAGQN